MNNTIEMHGFRNGSIASLEAHGLSQVFKAYSYHCAGERISEIGFNPNTGYVYIALEDGIQICSCLGSDIEYLVTNYDNGEETFFYSYDEAQEFNNNLNQ